MKSYFEEFDKKYSRPRMERITVGFSGIDPAPKSSGSGGLDMADLEAFFGDINNIDCGEIS